MPGNVNEVSTYFDTPGLALAECGLNLRVRRTGDGWVQTLKADARHGVAADRAEWEWPLISDHPDLALLAMTPVADRLPANLEVTPVFATEIDRTTRALKLGDTVAEAAWDQGLIVTGERKEAICELELELLDGDAAAMYRLAVTLHEDLPFRIAGESKAARGYRLRSGAPPVAEKARSVVVPSEVPSAEAFRQIVLAGLGHLVSNQPAALAGNPEGVHQTRGAVRRLRTALLLFKPHLEPHATARFEDALRSLGRIFGAAHRRCVEELHAPTFTSLILGLAAWAEQGHAMPGLVGDDDLQRPIEALCHKLLDRLARKVVARGRHVNRSDGDRHALRKSLKKLRYAIEYVQALYPRKPARAYLRACKRLQLALGDINDAVSATVLASSLAGETRPDMAPAIGALATWLGVAPCHGADALTRCQFTDQTMRPVRIRTFVAATAYELHPCAWHQLDASRIDPETVCRQECTQGGLVGRVG